MKQVCRLKPLYTKESNPKIKKKRLHFKSIRVKIFVLKNKTVTDCLASKKNDAK